MCQSGGPQGPCGSGPVRPEEGTKAPTVQVCECSVLSHGTEDFSTDKAAGSSSKPMLTPGPRKGLGLGCLGPVYALQTHLTSVTPLLWMDLTASSMRLCLWSLASQSLGVLFKNPFNPGPRPP